MKPTFRTKKRRRPAFTMLELIVVIVLILVVAAILLSTIHKTRGNGVGRIACANNLSSIYKAMYLYSTRDHAGSFPRTKYVPDAMPTFHYDPSNGAAAVNPFVDKPWADYPNDVTMSVFLILRTQDITAVTFTCPGVGGDHDTYGTAPGAGPDRKASFSAAADLSYSFTNMFPSAAAVKGGFKWDNSLPSEFAIVADQNPGIGDDYDVTLPADSSASMSEMKKANSRNHAGAGQNVLYGDGHVQFETNPFVGYQHDNIYTVSGSTDGTITTSKIVIGMPQHAHDSVLLPPFK